MAIRTRTVVEATCELCSEPIDTSGRYVDAGVYGAAFHRSCIIDHNTFTPLAVMKALGLDDIRDMDGSAYLAKTIYH